MRVALAACAVVVALVLSGTGCVLSLPGVDDAEAKVHQILATHHAGFTSLPLPPKLAAAVVPLKTNTSTRHFRRHHRGRRAGGLRLR